MALFIALPVYAVKPSPSVIQQKREEKKLLIGQMKEEKKELIEQNKENRLQIREDLKERISSKATELKKKLSQRVVLKDAKVTSKNGNALGVSSDGKNYTVNVTDSTIIVRRYYGKTTIDDIQVGHILMVLGLYTDDAQTVIDAKLIRDLSIQKRFGAFVGTVTAVSGNIITFNTVHRGEQKAVTDSSTVFVNRRGETIQLADIKVGHRIRVKGMWDNSVDTISEITHVKNYSIPVPTGKTTPVTSVTPVPSVTLTVTPSPTATVAPTATLTPSPTPAN